MSPDGYATYINDHLAGSVAAIELLDHLCQAAQGTERETLLLGLQRDIEEDQAVLRQLLKELGGTESKFRKVAAWLTEKIGEAKLKLDDRGSGELQWLEALETLGLGIHGKLGLWRALETVRDRKPELQSLDLERLKSRALDQYGRVEAERIRVARRALSD
ncbi:MAG TPA: hypothetical protein VJ808_08230 [Gemmatimonadales bacterium]|nr:hypothetical protein [Gemmatimonadales bacterium]